MGSKAPLVKPGAVSDVGGKRCSPRQVRIEADVQRVSLIVVQRRPSDLGVRSGNRQTSGDRAHEFRHLIRVRQMHLASAPQARRPQRQLPAADQRVLRRQREIDVRGKDLAVRGRSSHFRDPKSCSSACGTYRCPRVHPLYGMVTPNCRSVSRSPCSGINCCGFGVAHRRVHKCLQRPWSADGDQRRRLIELPVEAAKDPIQARNLDRDARPRAGRIFRDRRAKRSAFAGRRHPESARTSRRICPARKPLPRFR